MMNSPLSYTWDSHVYEVDSIIFYVLIVYKQDMLVFSRQSSSMKIFNVMHVDSIDSTVIVSQFH